MVRDRFVPVPVPRDLREGDIVEGFKDGYLVVKYKVLRVCKSCGRKARNGKQLNRFRKDKNSRWGRMNKCKECRAKEKTGNVRRVKTLKLIEANPIKAASQKKDRKPATYEDWLSFFSYRNRD